jgi:uncharacterized protein YdbL (DUF1318 family)
MKRAMSVPRLTGLLAVAFLAGCVTVNVYFPAAEAQKAADKIIDAVTGGTGTQAPQDQPSKPPAAPAAQPPSADSGSLTGPGSVLLAATGRVLALLVPAAAAQEQANLDISTPQIRAIIASMHARFQHLKPFFISGVVGVTAQGTIAVRDAGSVPLAQRAMLLGLIAQQNRDLSLLYTEIAKANGHPEWASDIRTVFAKRWMAHARQNGWYYRDSGGSWRHN